MRVENLYGIISSGNTELGPLKILPSKELYRELLGLPKGSRIGIEYAPEFLDGFNIGGYCFDGSSNKYWTRLERVLKMGGMTVVMLEDIETWKKYAQKVTQVASLQRKLDEISLQLGKESSDSELNEDLALVRKLYRLGVERDYAHSIERGRKIAENMKKGSLDAAVISTGIADSLVVTGKLSFNKYCIEEPSDYGTLDDYDKPTRGIFFDDILRDVIHSQLETENLAIEEEFLVRKYTAVKKGKVLDNPQTPPLFRGTWDPTNIPERGLFEIYVDTQIDIAKGTGMTGVIEDCLGSAHFAGRIDDQEIYFEKEYMPLISSSDILPGIIKYHATRIGETEYQGEFRTPAGIILYPFRMQRLN